MRVAAPRPRRVSVRCGGGARVAPTFGDEPAPGGYHRRRPEGYDRALCLILADVVDFLLATQPRQWQKLEQHHGADVKPRFLARLSREIARRGALDVLRNGVKDSGCKFRLAYFRPASGLNEESQRLHAANLFAVVRQLRFSEQDEQSIDLALFLNGVPIFTAELKNPLTGQDVQDAIRQFREDRDPREPLFAYARCLAHFAVDPEQVFVTTCLAGPKTRFLPFNRGRFGGAGNPPVPPTRAGFPHRLPVGGGLGARQRPRPRSPVHPRGRDGGRRRAQDGRAVPDLPALPAARLRAPARAPRAEPRTRPALPRPALGRQRQELHHRVARPPALGAARPRRPARLRLGRGGDRPARPRPPAPAQHPPVRADPRGGGEHRPHLAPAPRGPRGGPDHHRHHPPEVPGHRRADRRVAGAALRRDRRRGALVAVGREHQEPQGGARGREPGRRRAGGGRGPDPGGGARRPCPRRDPQPRAVAQPLDVRVHRDPQAQDAGALRPEAARREVRALPPLHQAAGHRGGVHPRRARQLLDVQGLLAPAEDDRGRPALRPRQGRVPAQVVRRAAPARHRREGRHLRRALRGAGRRRHRRAGQGDGRDPLAPARGAHPACARRLPRREGPPVEGARRLLGHRAGRRRDVHRVGHELGPAGPRRRRAADGGRVREARVPLPGGRQQVPDRLRPAAAAHHVRGQGLRRTTSTPSRGCASTPR